MNGLIKKNVSKVYFVEIIMLDLFNIRIEVNVLS